MMNISFNYSVNTQAIDTIKYQAQIAGIEPGTIDPEKTHLSCNGEWGSLVSDYTANDEEISGQMTIEITNKLIIVACEVIFAVMRMVDIIKPMLGEMIDLFKGTEVLEKNHNGKEIVSKKSTISNPRATVPVVHDEEGNFVTSYEFFRTVVNEMRDMVDEEEYISLHNIASRYEAIFDGISEDMRRILWDIKFDADYIFMYFDEGKLIRLKKNIKELKKVAKETLY